jgi:hypothetical protein
MLTRLLALVLYTLTIAGATKIYFSRSEPLEAPAEEGDVTLRLAESVLRHAGAAVPDDVNPRGGESAAGFAWRFIVFDRAAIPTFLRLARTGTPAGKLYALAGLYARNYSQFASIAGEVAISDEVVDVIFGCIVSGDIPLRYTVQEIASGEWTRARPVNRGIAPPATSLEDAITYWRNRGSRARQVTSASPARR